MKSRISIGVDHMSQPVIKIDYTPSEDVRDVLVGQLLTKLGHTSNWFKCYFALHEQNGAKGIEIFPVTPDTLIEESKLLKLRGEEFVNMNKGMESNL